MFNLWKIIMEYLDVSSSLVEKRIPSLEHFIDPENKNQPFISFLSKNVDYVLSPNFQFYQLGFFGLYEFQLRKVFERVQSLISKKNFTSILPFWRKKIGKKISGVFLWQEHQHSQGLIWDPIQNLKIVQNQFPPNFAYTSSNEEAKKDFYYLRGVVSDLWLRTMLKTKEHFTLYYLDEWQSTWH